MFMISIENTTIINTRWEGHMFFRSGSSKMFFGMICICVLSLLLININTVYGQKQTDESFGEGYKYLSGKDLNNAIVKYTKATESNPKDSNAYVNLGIAYYMKGKYDKSISFYNKAIEIDQNNARAYFNRGALYLNKCEYDNSLSDINKAIELNPKYAKAYYYLGLIYCMKGDHDKSFFNHNKAAEIDPKDAYVHCGLGSYYFYLGDYNKAISEYSIAIELDPSFSGAYGQRGHLYKIKGDYDKAISDYNKELDNCSNYSIQASRGMAYEMKGDYDKAILDYKKAIKDCLKFENNQEQKREELCNRYYDLACLYSLQKSKLKSLEYLSKAIDLGYDNIEDLKEDGSFDFVREDPRFAELLNKLEKGKLKCKDFKKDQSDNATAEPASPLL